MYSGILTRLIKRKDGGELYYNWGEIAKIPEFAVLKETKQPAKWHSEGSVWNHTRLVCEKMLKNYSAVPIEDRYICMAAALFHDIGKGITTKLNKRGDWSSYKHDEAGVSLTRRILYDVDIETREQICLLVKYHMKPLKVFDDKNYLTKIKDIVLSGVNIYYLRLLKDCDLEGSICETGYNKEPDYDKVEEFFNLCIALKPHCQKIKRNAGMASALPKSVFAPDFSLNPKFHGSDNQPIIMLIGLPGAGKDTLINKYFSGPEYAPLSRDEIRIQMGLCKKGEKCVGTKEQEDAVTREFNETLLHYVELGLIPIINNTNLSRKRRNSFKELLKGRKIDWWYIYLEAPSLDDNKKRRDGQIKPEVLDSMFNRLEFPEYGEYSSLTTYISNNDE